MTGPIPYDYLSGERSFAVRRSLLDERLDAEYYHPKHYRLLDKLRTSDHSIVSLNSISSRVVDGPFGSAIKASDYAETGIPFLRVADVTKGEGQIALKGIVYITPEAHARILRSRVMPNDVVIAKTGATMGAASLIPVGFPEANIRADLAVITLHDPDLAQYVVNYVNTRMGQQLFWRLNSGATRGRVVIENLRGYPIVLPPKTVRHHINKIIKDARQRKKEAEVRAVQLLEKIDEVLLHELGIKLPAEHPNTLNDRMFIQTFSSVTGQRIDPNFYHPKYLKLVSSLMGSSFKKVRLGIISPSIVGGATPDTSKPEFYVDEGIKFFRIMNIGVNEFDLTDLKFITSEIHDSYLRRSQLQENDVLMTITGRVGNAAVVTANLLPANINQHIVALRLRSPSDVLPEFLSAYLNSSIGRILSNRWVTGGTRIALDYAAIKAILIPIPGPKVQGRICSRLFEIRQQVSKIQNKAMEDLEQSRKRIENMILGMENHREA